MTTNNLQELGKIMVLARLRIGSQPHRELEKLKVPGSLLAQLMTEKLIGSDEKRRWEITAAGKKWLNEQLALQAFPEKMKWSEFMKKYVIPISLGLQVSELKTKSPEPFPKWLHAKILRRDYQLKVAENAKLQQVGNALVWKELGGEPGKRVTLAGLRKLVLAKALGSPSRLSEIGQLGILAERKLGKPIPSERDVSKQLFQSWPAGPAPSLTAQDEELANEKAKAKVQAAQAEKLKLFAKQALVIGKHEKVERFGDHKAFIVSVWRVWQELEEGKAGTLPFFKKRLLQAHQAGLLNLTRADLVSAMDPENLEKSSIPYANTIFHFIECA
jgi:hypothetical protein